MQYRRERSRYGVENQDSADKATTVGDSCHENKVLNG